MANVQTRHAELENCAAFLIAQNMHSAPHQKHLACPDFCTWAHGVVVSHPLRMRKALGSIPSVSIAFGADEMHGWRSHWGCVWVCMGKHACWLGRSLYKNCKNDLGGQT